MAIRVNNYGSAEDAAKRLKKVIDELSEGKIESRVVRTVAPSGGHDVGLYIGGNYIRIAGEVQTLFSGYQAPILSYGVGDDAYMGIPGLVAETKTTPMGDVIPGRVVDPYTVAGSLIVKGVQAGKSPLEALVSGAGGYPGIQAISPQDPYARVVQAASSLRVLAAKPNSLNEAIRLVTSGKFSELEQEPLRYLSYRGRQETDGVESATLSVAYTPRSLSDPAKNQKSSTLGLRTEALTAIYGRTDTGQKAFHEVLGEHLVSNVTLPWEEGGRVTNIAPGEKGFLRVVHAIAPLSLGGAMPTRAEALGKTVAALPGQKKIALQSIESVDDFTKALSESNFVEAVKRARSVARPPGAPISLGKIGDVEIAIPGRASTQALRNAFLEVPQYYNIASGKFADAFEALTEKGELRKGYALTDVRSILERAGVVKDNEPLPFPIATTASATPRVIAETIYETDASMKTSGFKAGIVPIAGDLSYVVGNSVLPVDAVTGDIKKPHIAFWEAIGRKSAILQEYASEAQSEAARKKYSSRLNALHKLIAEAAGRAGFDINQFSPDIGVYDLRMLGGAISAGEGMFRIYAEAQKILQEQVEASKRPMVTTQAQLRKYGVAYAAPGHLAGLTQHPDTVEHFQNIAKRVGLEKVLEDPYAVRQGAMIFDVPKRFVPEYFGKAAIDMPMLYGALSKGEPGRFLLQNLGLDITDLDAGKTFAEAAMAAEAPGKAGWRAIVGGALMTNAALSGLDIESPAVQNLSEAQARAVLSIMGGQDLTTEERLRLASQYLAEQGIDNRLLRYNNAILPHPAHVLSAAHADETGELVGVLPRSYFMAAADILSGSTPEVAQQSLFAFYNTAISKLSNKSISKMLGSAQDVSRAFSGRYIVSPYLGKDEIFFSRQRLLAMAKRAGWRDDEARAVVEQAIKTGSVSVAALRQPNTAAEIQVRKYISKEQLIRRIMEQDNVSEQAARAVAERMEHGIFTGHSFAAVTIGDVDDDPITLAPLLPVKGQGALQEQLEKIRSVQAAFPATPEESIAEMVPTGKDLWFSISETASSLEDMAKGISHTVDTSYALTLEGNTQATQDVARSKLGMGMTYNSRRTLRYAMDVGDVDISLAHKIFKGTTPMYQYQLDLQAQARMLLDALSRPSVSEFNPRLRRLGSDKPEFQLRIWGESTGATADTEELAMAVATGMSGNEAYKNFAKKIYTQAAGGVATDLAGVNGPPSMTTFSAAGILLGGTQYESEIEKYAKQFDEILQGPGDAKTKAMRLSGVLGELTAKVGAEAYKTPIFRTVLTGAVESVLAGKDAEKVNAGRALLTRLNELGGLPAQEVRKAIVAAGLSTVEKAKGDPIWALTAASVAATQLGNVGGPLTNLALSSFGFKGLKLTSSSIDLNRAPGYLSVRDLAAAMSGSGFESNKASLALRTLQARFPGEAEHLSPRNFRVRENAAMRAGNLYEDVVVGAQSNVVGTQLSISGKLHGTALRGVMDYIRLEKDALVIGDAKVSSANAKDALMYQRQVQLYGTLLHQTAQDDYSWSQFVQENKIDNDTASRMRELILAGKVRGELAVGDRSMLEEIAKTAFGGDFDATDPEHIERLSAMADAAGAVHTTEIDISPQATSALAATAIGELAATPTQELVDTASKSLRHILRHGGHVKSNLFEALRRVSGSGATAGAQSILGMLGLTIEPKITNVQRRTQVPAPPQPQPGEAAKETARTISPQGLYTPFVPKPTVSAPAGGGNGENDAKSFFTALTKMFASSGGGVPQNWARQTMGSIVGHAYNAAMHVGLASHLFESAKGELAKFNEFLADSGIAPEKLQEMEMPDVLKAIVRFALHPQNAARFSGFLKEAPSTAKMLDELSRVTDADWQTVAHPEGRIIAAQVAAAGGINPELMAKLANRAVNIGEVGEGGLSKSLKTILGTAKRMGVDIEKGSILDDPELAERFEDVKKSAERIRDKFDAVSKASQRLYDEFRETGKVTRKTRMQLRSALEEAIKADAEAKATSAEFTLEAAKKRYSTEQTPESAAALSSAARAAQRARASALKTQHTASDQAARILNEFEPEAFSSVLSKSMRQMFGGFGMFYMMHLLNMPRGALAQGYAEEEQVVTQMQQMAASVYGAPSGIASWEGRKAALASRYSSPYGPLSYEWAKVVGGSGVVGASLMTGAALTALTGYLAPGALRVGSAAASALFGTEALSASAVSSLAGTAMAWAAPIGLAVGAGLYTYGLVENPQAKWSVAASEMRARRGQPMSFREYLDAKLMRTFAPEDVETASGAVNALYTSAFAMRPEAAAQYASSSWILPEEELSKYSKQAQTIARQLRYIGAVTGSTYLLAGQDATSFGGRAPDIEGYQRRLLGVGEQIAAGAQYDVVGQAIFGLGASLTPSQRLANYLSMYEAEKPYVQKYGRAAMDRGYKMLAALPATYREQLRSRWISQSVSQSLSGSLRGFTGIAGPGADMAASYAAVMSQLTDQQQQIFGMSVQTWTQDWARGIISELPLPSSEIPVTPQAYYEQSQEALYSTMRTNVQQNLMGMGYDFASASAAANQTPMQYLPAWSGFGKDIVTTSFLASIGAPGVSPFMTLSDLDISGKPTGISTPFTSSLVFAGQSPFSMATQIWGEHLDKYVMGAINGVKAGWNPNVTLYGMKALQQEMSDLQYEAQMASIGNAYQREMLRWNFMTGGPGFGGGFSWHVAGLGGGSAGGGQWGYQDIMRQMARARQRFEFQMQEQQMAESQQYFAANFAMNLSQFTIGREYTRAQWALSDQARALQWGWRVSDLEENMAFASGRQRKLLERQLSRETAMHNIQQETTANQREYQEQVWRIQKKRFEEERRHHEEMMRMQRQRHTVSKKLFEERARAEDKFLKMQRKFAEENHKLALAAIGSQAYYAKEMHKLKEDTRGLADAQQRVMAAWSLATRVSANAVIEIAQRLKELFGINIDIGAAQSALDDLRKISTPHGSVWSHTPDVPDSNEQGNETHYKPRSHVGGFAPAHQERILKEGEVMVVAGHNARVLSEHEVSDPFASLIHNNPMPDNEQKAGERIEVIISSDDFREFVREVVVSELRSQL